MEDAAQGRQSGNTRINIYFYYNRDIRNARGGASQVDIYIAGQVGRANRILADSRISLTIVKFCVSEIDIPDSSTTRPRGYFDRLVQLRGSVNNVYQSADLAMLIIQRPQPISSGGVFCGYASVINALNGGNNLKAAWVAAQGNCVGGFVFFIDFKPI